EKYIFTNINLDYENFEPAQNYAWIQRTVSALVLRSLYLRNAFVEAFNSRNMVAIFLPLKALFETVGALAWILDLLEQELPSEELREKLQPFALGNRGKGNLRVGTLDVPNVATMIEKADKYISNMRTESGTDSEQKGKDTFFTDFYDIPANLSHPSFDAYDLVSSLKDGGTWYAEEPEETKAKIISHLPMYGGILMSTLFIQNVCAKIYEKGRDGFAQVQSELYFK
ncbi:hypothetical protein K8R03_04735, partial [Candidatus Kaiserbacteria bacterium]|nr:hypothetical protein [Candidatus Kaiserbacteria bacterium]